MSATGPIEDRLAGRNLRNGCAQAIATELLVLREQPGADDPETPVGGVVYRLRRQLEQTSFSEPAPNQRRNR